MSKVRDHVHRLKRTTYPTSGTKVYFCTKDCSYKIEVAFALGKVVECPICGGEFAMNEYSVKLALPHCNNCGKMQVKDESGKRKFIPKGRKVEAFADLAKAGVDSMRQRLGQVVTLPKDEDI